MCHKQTDKPDDYYTRGRPRAPRVITLHVYQVFVRVRKEEWNVYRSVHMSASLPNPLPTPTINSMTLPLLTPLSPLQDGLTALDIAKEAGFTELMTLLGKHFKSKYKR